MKKSKVSVLILSLTIMMVLGIGVGWYCLSESRAEESLDDLFGAANDAFNESDNPPASLPANPPTRPPANSLDDLFGAANDALGNSERVGATPATDSKFISLWKAVLKFRGKAATEGQSAWTEFASPAVQSKILILNAKLWGESDRDCGWSYFFSLALFDIGKASSDTPIVGFYHPWSDTWVITEWQLAPQPQITDIYVLCGDWVRLRGKGPLDLRPDWIRRKGFRVEQLALATGESILAFDRVMFSAKPWRELLRLYTNDPSLQEANEMACSLNLLGGMMRSNELAVGDPEKPKLQELISAAGQFLAAGRTGNIAPLVESAVHTSPDAAKLISAIESKAFLMLQPTYWVADDEGAIAIFAPELNPDFCVALTYRRVSASLSLDRIDYLHFPTVIKLVADRATKEEK